MNNRAGFYPKGKGMVIHHDPDNYMDYTLDLRADLFGGPATSVTVVSQSGIEVEDAIIPAIEVAVEEGDMIPPGYAISFWLTGGELGVAGRFTLRVEAGARSFDRSYEVIVLEF